ncbi:protein CutA homolog [Spea bombifrons]|uniref:protein CutA homolog n=1 Tax=Spea bombifrons TaxID=233779 RepID=UPI00234B9CBC|nr:protein CutA homolog [Spea bombifrons]
MGFWSQICQIPSSSWPRPSWSTVLLVMIGSCLMYPVIRSLYFGIHSSFTGSYIPGSHSLAFINCPNEEIAKDIARGILEKRLAAGVNIMPKTSSLYLWKGEIEESSETLLVAKTKTTKVFELSSYVGLVHPFQTPDFISIPIDRGNPDYLRWIEEVMTETES